VKEYNSGKKKQPLGALFSFWESVSSDSKSTDEVIGANTLLAYFHYCNKGIYPFSEECRDQDLQTLAALDDWAIPFVHETRRYAAEHSK